MNCKNCGYKYCPFRGVDREISAYLCEDFEEADEERREYEAQVEAAQYCEIYETTYDPETGAL